MSQAIPDEPGGQAGGLHVDPAHEARARELAARLDRYKASYYAGHPEVSDAAYDALEDELRELDPTRRRN